MSPKEWTNNNNKANRNIHDALIYIENKRYLQSFFARGVSTQLSGHLAAQEQNAHLERRLVQFTGDSMLLGCFGDMLFNKYIVM